ncbi:alpha/beta fold hydrolase [Mycolicibacterium hassiacum]|uniref:alpha/beta fold hydrolase n=2 Tax=Mycolicibacterium hassiacum TaxID=46351 RepID=UPI0005658E82|nr:alpha/beta fold hydrolase [Mycolicibacterium hassiacum]MBX5486014.1 alpha/beta fold hydrolase [Mycolicibacterium hassiacum]PZN22078.1 MAG: alpha/beta hydrolase [Mycolicibacterium hassiacum]
MTMTALRRHAHDRLAALPGVRPVRRPITDAAGGQFDLYFVRSGLKSAHPVLIIPGGPGVASVAPYRGFRRRAAVAGLDVLMVEHRGVGLSRFDDNGAELPPEALTVNQAVDDLAAVLDDAGVGKAIVYGTSYGSYLAAGFGVRHRDRVHAMVLDSPVLSAHDIDDVRAATRRSFWHGQDPETASLAAKVRRLAEQRVLTPEATALMIAVYGYAGAPLLERAVDLLLDGRRWLWSALEHVTRMVFERQAPFQYENDLVARIAYRELNYAADPDGEPLDPAAVYHQLSGARPFESEPYDLAAEMPAFSWPTVVVSGGRDLITPPSVAQRVASLIPDAVLVSLPTAGHSMLNMRERAALEIIAAVRNGTIAELPQRQTQLDALPAPLSVRALVRAIESAAGLESALPAAMVKVRWSRTHRDGRRVTAS